MRLWTIAYHLYDSVRSGDLWGEFALAEELIYAYSLKALQYLMGETGVARTLSPMLALLHLMNHRQDVFQRRARLDVVARAADEATSLRSEGGQQPADFGPYVLR